jgi:hypothetical protein
MAVVAAVFLFIIGVGLLTLGFNRRLYSIRSNHQLAARAAADYGLTEAVYEMNRRLPAGITSPLTKSNTAINGTNVDGSSATYSYTVTVNNPHSVTAHGTSGSITKTVSCELRRKSIFEYAILTKNTLNIWPCSTVNCLNCGDIPLQIGTTSNQKDTIILKSGSTIDGDILYGEGGITSEVVNNQNATVTGDVYAVATDFDLPTPTVPAYFSSAPNKGAISASGSLSTPGNYIYTKIDLKNGGTLNINANVELYITGDIILKNGADINIAPNVKVAIYLAGAFDGYYGAGFNDHGDPRNLTIYGLAANSIIIKNSDAFCGTIYAPNADVTIDAKAKVYGSIIANTYIQKNSAIFTYDGRLRQITDANLYYYVPTHWREL